MKQYIYLLVTIIFLVTTAFCQPKLSIDKMEINWGDIYSGSKQKSKITLKNIGKDTLKINNVYASCGCTAVKKPKDFIPPKKSDEVEVEFNSSGFRGAVTKYLHINTNDPNSPLLIIKLIANVKEELESISGSNTIMFDNIPQNLSLTKEMQFKNISDHTIKIKTYQISSPSIFIKLDKEIINPSDTLKIEVTVKPQKEGRWTEYVTLKTDSKNQSEVEFKVSYMCIKAD